MEAGRTRRVEPRRVRLDPFSLPVRFEATDAAADEQRRIVELHRDRVVLRRSVRGMRMAVNMPVAAFRGVAIRSKANANALPSEIAVVLEHDDPALSLPLVCLAAKPTTSSPSGSAGAACSVCRCWSPTDDGSLREPFARLGAVRIEAPTCAPPPHHDRPPPLDQAAAPPSRHRRR